MTEMDKLEQYLKVHDIPYTRNTVLRKDKSLQTDQILVWLQQGNQWDAICHPGSYGYSSGLLEIAGVIARSTVDDDVEGWLTADDVISRHETYIKKLQE